MIKATPDRRFGLALSGGGFRAALYHLGVIRFLRDTGALPKVTKITSVSGGSVLAAHLVLNWNRYCGSERDFQAAADELLRFIRMDVRNRIVRRFPLTACINGIRRVARMEPRRQYTRTGLLEQHYQKHLYGDVGLFQLPETPRLYILATNLSQGSLCAFHRDGLLLQRRLPGRKQSYFVDVEMGLATISMAVAASSAFPGFFPPLELKCNDVGANEEEFSRQSFTDGGIYDNLGLRMFHHLRHAGLSENPTRRVDVVDRMALSESLKAGASMPRGTPLRELIQRIKMAGSPSGEVSRTLTAIAENPDAFTAGLNELIDEEELYRLPEFQTVPLGNPRAKGLMGKLANTSAEPDHEDRAWLNLELAAATFEQAAGRPCLRPNRDNVDQIMVSDAGASFKVRSDGRSGGLLSTAIRSTDILMDRVNQLELESCDQNDDALFFHISSIVHPEDDPTAPHPEIQRQAASIRTDMDSFSNLEITSLVRHGYCVARQACQKQLLLAEEKIGNQPPPWDPIQFSPLIKHRTATTQQKTETVLESARILQRSSFRRTLATLFSAHDWPSYLWLPAFFVIITILPYLMYRNHLTSVHQASVMSIFAGTNPVYHKVLAMLDDGPMTHLRPIEFDEVESVEPLDFAGYDVILDDRIYDFRGWTSSDRVPKHEPQMHAHLRFRRTDESLGKPTVRIQLPSNDEELRVEYLPTSLNPVHRRSQIEEQLFLYETELDFSGIPIGFDTNVIVNQVLPSTTAMQDRGSGKFRFSIVAKTGLVRIWILMPPGRKHSQFQLVGFPMDAPDQPVIIDATTTIELPIGSIASFQMINPKNHYRYECRWNWKE